MEGTPIRPARRADLPSLVLLWTAMMEENARFDPRLEVHPEARDRAAALLAAHLDDPTRVVLVAEEAHRLVVGFAAGGVTAGEPLRGPARVGQVTDCFVAPPRRGAGVGRRLATRVCDLLLERGVECVRLQIAARNPGALAFWDALGFVPLEDLLDRPADPASDPTSPSR